MVPTPTPELVEVEDTGEPLEFVSAQTDKNLSSNGANTKENASVVGEQAPTLASLLKFAGIFDDLPADAAMEHNHYLYGTPKT